MIRRLLMVACALAAMAGADARAALLVTYDFTGQPGDQASTTRTFAAAGVTATPIVRGPGLAVPSPSSSP
jgi:hypothetical protein